MSPAKKKDPSEVKNAWLKVRTTEERLERWQTAQEQAQASEDDDDLDFSAWVRRALNRAMEQEAAARLSKKVKSRPPR